MRLSATRLALGSGLLALIAAATPARADFTAPDLQIAVPAELSGSGASVGVLWRDGVHMAIDDVNAKGGVLGHKLVATDYDTQTNPSVSRAVIQKALDGHPYAVLGPVYSGSVKVDEELTKAAHIAEIMGGEAGDLTTLGDAYVFRTGLGQAQTIPPVVAYMAHDLKAKRIAMIWVNDDYGKGGRDAFLADAKKAGLNVVADLSSEVGQVNFQADVLRLRASHPDAVFIYLHEEEAARFLKGARQMGVAVPMVGGTTVIDSQTMKLAGSAANGVVGFSGLATGAPMPAVQNFVQRFQAEFHVHPDHNAIKGYMAVWMVKAATEKMGKPDATGLAAALHGLMIEPASEPGILLPMHVLANGDVDNGGFMVVVKDGQQHIIRIMKPSM